MSVEQPTLFDQEDLQRLRTPPDGDDGTAISASTRLADAMGAFERHMVTQGFTAHTVNSFLGDMSLLLRRLGKGIHLGEIGTNDLNRYLQWLAQGRGVACSPKSYARRVTTLKVFFGWLRDEGIIPTDPADQVVQLKAVSPLPAVLYDGQIEQVLAVTRGLMVGAKPDPRPHLLVMLLLSTAIKKGECMQIRLGHIDLSNPRLPILWVRYENPRYRLKERKLRLPPDLPSTLARYREQYQPKTVLFPCTGRNLEYVLRDVAQRAGVEGGISFEMLRWTCAVRDYREGMDQDLLRRKMGLSPITWKDTLEKIQRLAEPAL